MYVHGKNVITDITVNDGEWHFICTTWSSLNGKYDIYIDGILRDSGNSLSTSQSIEANGTIIVGQEQDSIGSSFSDSESFIGRIAYTDIWSRRISAEEMFEFYTTCEPYQGNLYTWTDFRAQIYGAVKVGVNFFVFLNVSTQSHLFDFDFFKLTLDSTITILQTVSTKFNS